MSKKVHTMSRNKWLGAIMAVAALLLPAASASAMSVFYTKTNLVSDVPGLATTTDSELVNPWGLSRSAAGPWWISDGGSGKSSVYNGQGTSLLPGVSIPSPSGGAGAPTGTVFNADSTAFVVKKGATSGASSFLFATEDGTLLGWNKNVDSASAIIALDRSQVTNTNGVKGASYKGLAYGVNNSQPYVYATNFRFGTVEMFDKNFKLAKSFTDSQLTGTCPIAGQCYAPFGIQNIGGDLYVTFALQDAEKHDDQAGKGHGFVDIFSPNGTLLRRLISGGELNSPWALALAPHNFGLYSDDLLVGNFGDGTINAYSIHTGIIQGKLLSQQGKPVQVDGLWGLAFGNNGLAGKSNELFFTAGIDDEAHGVFGKITAQ